MDLEFTLRLFAVALSAICAALVPFVASRDMALARRIVEIKSLPHPRWPALATRFGFACVLVSFVFLLAGCFLLA